MENKIINLKLEDILDLIKKDEKIVSDGTKIGTLLVYDQEISSRQKIKYNKVIDALIEKLQKEKFKINSNL